jgi:hypothetical protein
MTAGVLNSDTISEPAHSGSWDAWLDGYGTTHTDTLAQTVTIPSMSTTATFSFWLHIDTAEFTTPPPRRTTRSRSRCSTAPARSWRPAHLLEPERDQRVRAARISLASYIGQKITLKFTGSEDFSLQTSFVIDDTALRVS